MLCAGLIFVSPSLLFGSTWPRSSDSRDDTVLGECRAVGAKDELRSRLDERRQARDREVLVVERVVGREDLLGLRR
jgi:hypothetical protein